MLSTAEAVKKVAGAGDKREVSTGVLRQWRADGADSIADLSARLSELQDAIDSRESDAALELSKEICHWMSLELPVEESAEVIEAWVDDSFAKGLIGEAQIYEVAGRIAWSTRGRVVEPVKCDVTVPRQRFRAYLWLERARFLFAYDQVAKIAAVLGEPWSRNKFLKSMQMFVRLNKDADPDQLLDEVEMLWRDIESDELHAKCADVILHGIWLSYRMRNQGPLLLKYARIALDKKLVSTGVGYFRLATGHREIGDFDEAIHDLDTALDSLSGSNEFVRTFSEQIIREREFVLRTRQARMLSDESAGKIDELRQRASDELHSRLDVLKEEISEKERDSQSRLIQTVTFFTTAISFALGSVNVVAKDMTINGRVILMLTLGAGLLSFALVVSSILRVDSARGGRGASSTRNTAIALVAVQLVAVAVIVVLNK